MNTYDGRYEPKKIERKMAEIYQEYFGFIGPLEQAFLKYHSANPEVYAEIVGAARKLKATGRDVYGINSLIEVVRWHRNLSTRGDEFKINNNFAPFYSRLIMAREPDLAGFFNTRSQRIPCSF